MTPPVVYKVGGPALEDAALLAPLAAEVKRAAGPWSSSTAAGARSSACLKALGIESRFVDGRRATSPEAMEVVEMVLSGVDQQGPGRGPDRRRAARGRASPAATPASSAARLEPGLGRVGTPETVDPTPRPRLWAAGLVPVVSPVSDGPSGEA